MLNVWYVHMNSEFPVDVQLYAELVLTSCGGRFGGEDGRQGKLHLIVSNFLVSS